MMDYLDGIPIQVKYCRVEDFEIMPSVARWSRGGTTRVQRTCVKVPDGGSIGSCKCNMDRRWFTRTGMISSV